MSLAADIEAVLSHLDPEVKVHATAEKDGTRIVVEVGGQTHWFSIGQGQSVLVNYLLTGSAA